MRIFAIVAAIAVLAAPAAAADRNFGVANFTKVRVDGPYKVRLSTGVAPFARATGSAAALDRIAVDVQGETLVVHSNVSSWGGYPGRDSGPVEIVLGTHDLAAAWVNGSGTLAVDKVRGLKFDLSVQGSGGAEIARLTVDQLNVNVAGNANARLSGQVGKVTSVVRGISSLDAGALAAKDATFGADGAATIVANVSNAVKLDISGPATVRLSGRPSCTLRVSGSADVSGCR